MWCFIFSKKAVLVFAFAIIFTSVASAQNSKKPVSDLLFEITQNQGVDKAIAKYRELRKMENQEYDLSEGQLNRLGYRLLNDGKNEEAVAIFELNTRQNPKSVNVWDSLGEAYLVAGKKQAAITQYQKVLKMLKSDTTLPPPTKNFYRNNADFKIFEARHFDPPAQSEFHYVSFFGGPAAGKWDMRNVADFKDQQDLKLSYQGNNLYRSPVPQNIAATFSGNYPANVSHSFIAGDYRRFIEAGDIKDISVIWEENNWDAQFPASFKQMASYNGRQYFVPMAYQWNPIWYRKDIFEKHDLNPPTSWEELLTLCDRLNELGYAPFSISVQNWPPPIARWFTILNLRLNGPEFHERVMHGEISFTSDKIKNVFVHWRELFRHKAFADSSYKNTYTMGVNALTSGKAVMYNLGEWIFESLNEQQGSQLDFFVFPQMNPDVTSAEIVHAYGAFMMSSNSRPEDSEKLLEWLASAESQQSNAEANGRVVAHQKVDMNIYSDIQKRITEKMQNTEVLIPLLEMNTHPEFAQQALKIFQEYWENPEDIDAALAKLEKARVETFD